MKAVIRLGQSIAVAAAIAATPIAARAQEADQPPPSETVGPRELQNFTIDGRVTTPATPQQQRPTTAVPPPTTAPAERPATSTTTRPNAPSEEVASRPREAPLTSDATRRAATPAEPKVEQPAPTPSAIAPIPSANDESPDLTDGLPPSVPAAPLASGDGFSLVPWLVAAFMLLLGGGFLWWRKNGQHPSYANADFDAAYAPTPPAPPAPPLQRAKTPAAAPPTAAPVGPRPDPLPGLVSTRLRPWIDLGFEPARCAVEDDKVTIEFDIEMVNSGNAPARGVLVEARMINASAEQDQVIGQFFANPVGQGERIDVIAPMKSVRFRSRIVTDRHHVQEYDVGGRKVFVPLVAFNVLYGWARGEGQTSSSYLVGRDTKGDKMAPFRLDAGPRMFRQLGKRPLPIAVRH